jgi:hypothetical protein
MKTILEALPCCREVGEMDIEELDGTVRRSLRPPIYVLSGVLALPYDPVGPRHAIEVEALLDTGCDVTLIRLERLRELEARRGTDVHLERRIMIGGELQSAFNLTYILPGGQECTSVNGFVGVPGDKFREVLDATDMLLGQDVLSQFIVTFDGPNGTVTILQP